MSSPVQVNHPPSKTQVLVIGGGPSGSYAATLLARENYDVTLVERDRFPRYHIGESLLPSIPHYLHIIDAYELFEAKKFHYKPGGVVKFNQYSRASYTDMSNLEGGRITWNVIRSEFDDLLLKNAASNGVKVFEETRVTSLEFDGERPISAAWQAKTGDQGTIKFEYLVDASGREGIMSTKYLKNRVVTQALKNLASWSYWKGGAVYGVGTPKEGAPVFEALTDETGWCWYIPLHNGTISVGVVINEAENTRKRKALREKSPDSTLKDYYLTQVKLATTITTMLEKAVLVSPEIKSASDYSYSATKKSGPGFRLVGDAAAFIDPFFASGVHLALTTGLSAACSIAASIRGDCSEETAAAFHNAKAGTSYVRFLLVVLGSYKQMKAQTAPILHNIDEAHFDRAIDLIKPLIQGEADVSNGLTEADLQNAVEFCLGVFAPTTPELHDEVTERLNKNLLDENAPPMLPKDVANVLGPDEDAVYVVQKVNARKLTHVQVDDVSGHFTQETFEGLVPSIQRGKLGLVPATQ